MVKTDNQRRGGERVRMIDMHAHFFCIEKEALVTEELKLRRADGLRTFFSCGTPEEWEKTKRLCQREEIRVSFGIHPWYADRYEVKEYMELFRLCDAVGEIGMDNVWCEVPYEIQRRQFAQQLEIAAQLGKSVILHTKGQEKEIARMIRDFPNPVCVHWYSGDLDTFEEFLERGCYFTLGPDFAQLYKEADTARLYGRMAREIPLERLFLETDGISAVAWALGSEYTSLDRISQVLWENARYLAEIRNIEEETLCRRMEQNLNEFLNFGKS
ncbi:MAG: TatD family hydrolase [Lachnospiraceae bacterium]|nr:TatD family hydrolase [Lachnospiraceae bacterium]